MSKALLQLVTSFLIEIEVMTPGLRPFEKYHISERVSGMSFKYFSFEQFESINVCVYWGRVKQQVTKW